jgi:hypothetical protein
MHQLNSQAFLPQVIISFYDHHLQRVTFVRRVLALPPHPLVNSQEALHEWVLHPLQPCLHRRRVVLLALLAVLPAGPVEPRLSVRVFLYNLVDLGEVGGALP